MCADIAVHSMELRILKNINWEYLSKIKTWHHLNYCIWRPWIRQEYINFNECNKPSTNHPKNKSKNQQYVQYRKIIATIEFTDRTDPPTLVAIKKNRPKCLCKGPNGFHKQSAKWPDSKVAQCHTSHSWPPRARAGKETWVLKGKKNSCLAWVVGWSCDSCGFTCWHIVYCGCHNNHLANRWYAFPIKTRVSLYQSQRWGSPFDVPKERSSILTKSMHRLI